MTWKLQEPLESVFFVADEGGLYLRSENPISWLEDEVFPKPLSQLGQSLPTLIPQLLELGFAEIISSNEIRISYDDFVLFDEREIYDFDRFLADAPFNIGLKTSGTLGLSDLQYSVSFFYGKSRISLERCGCFAKYRDRYYQFDNQTYYLLDEIARFRNLSSDQKNSFESLISFSKISGLSAEIGAQIDKFIENNHVLLPPKLGVDLIHEEKGRISFSPYIEGIEQEKLRAAFLSADDVTDLYFEDTDGVRVRLVFTPDQQEALRRMSKVRHSEGAEKVKILSNPAALFDGILDAIFLDIGGFGPRVKGIGDFPLSTIPLIRGLNTGVLDTNEDDSSDREGRSAAQAEILCRYADGSEKSIKLSPKELIEFNNDVQVAFENGQDIVRLQDSEIVIDRDFAQGVKDLAVDIHAYKSGNFNSSKNKKYLLIYKNEEELDYDERQGMGLVDEQKLFLPSALKDDVVLKPHQKEGIKWLQRCFLSEKKGALLADDMGLGKTLQVLTFIAWLIESGFLSDTDSVDPEKAPWNPILIVSPLVLLENETWIDDMKKFFKHEGSIFFPYLALYKQGLAQLRDIKSGSETNLQRPLLNLKELRKYRIVMTNYETVVNYQFSFASMKSNWTMIVTDEAQKQKTISSKTSHALKSCAPKFRVACTGTPVENRLLDMWNIMDYLQPGHLGSASEFTKKYEQPIGDDITEMELILGQLRADLFYETPHSFILRRDKATALKMVKKNIEKIYCDLSERQHHLHISFTENIKNGTAHPFTTIDRLMKLSQHSQLIDDPLDDAGITTSIGTCPKLDKCLEILSEVKSKGEKALIFVRSKKMQQILKASIFLKFRQPVDIINGDGRENTNYSKNTRSQMINEFKNFEKRNFIILSPEVAGMGLNLTEANHVIHYGRWWNPAKEAQATDRAYRIGQTKDVTVYILIAKDPYRKFKSFDERLDELIDRRQHMATSFLMPIPSPEVFAELLFEDFVKDAPVITQSKGMFTWSDVRLLTPDRFEACVAAIEEKRGNKVILTPKTGDKGFDVISINGQEAKLIQCKHTSIDSEVPETVVDTINNGLDFYQQRFFQKSQISARSILVTNGPVSKMTRRRCLEDDIEIIAKNELEKLFETYPISRIEIEAMERTRSSWPEIGIKIKSSL